jgi:uncharacterized membrane protein
MMEHTELLNLLFRWLHILGAVLWVGQIWSLALVLRLLPEDPADPQTVPLLLRSHKWSLWGSATTFLTGLALLGIVYYGGGALTTPDHSFIIALALGLAVVFGGFFIYDAIWKALRHQPVIAIIGSMLMLTGAAGILSQFLTGRAVFIHIGAMLGAIMASNTQQRIGPVDRLRLTGTDPAKAPSTDLVATASSRLRHNAALAPAVLLFMISNHYPTLYGAERSWLHVPAIVAVSWLMVKPFTWRR